MNNASEARRAELYALLLDLPPRDRPICAETVSQERHDTYTLAKLLLDLNGEEHVPAYFAVPNAHEGLRPAVLFSHSHGGNYSLGKDELLLGNTYLPGKPYIEELTDMGCCVLCIDQWMFGQRSGVSETDLFKLTLWQGKCLWGMMVYDSLRALDYLCGRPEVDTSRIGVMGMSMGSTMSWWLAALDTRVKACADICCLTDFNALIEEHGLGEHGVYYYVPSLIKRFSTSDINALIAPRHHFALAGAQDKLTPVCGLKKIDRDMKVVYAELNASEAWKLKIYDASHFETPEMRADTLSFLKSVLL